MMRSLFTGVSGLRNHQTDLDVVSNNIANINTLGFKVGRVTFKEAISQTLQGPSKPTGTLGGRNAMQIGLGMGIASIDTLFGQGQFQSTGNATDLAIEGDGFFVLSDGSGQFYTRVGSFRFDADGRLVAADGRAVQGRRANADGTIDAGAVIGDIVIPVGLRSEAEATTSVRVAGNLDASRDPVGNVVESVALLAEASSTDRLDGLRNGSGVALGLADGDTITFVANATETTRIGDLHLEDGSAISLGGATTITLSDGTTTVAITTLSDGSTLADLAAAIQGALASVTVAVTSDGALQFTNDGGSAISITASVSGTSAFNALARDVAVAAGGTNFSQRADARSEIAVGDGAGEVATVGSLAAALEAAFREAAGSGASVAFAGSRFAFTGGGTTVTGIQVLESGGATAFASALRLPRGTFGPAETISSDLFLDTAAREDSLASLRAADGRSLGIAAGGTIAFSAARGGTLLAPLSVTVGSDGTASDAAAGTYGGLLDEISSALGLASSEAVSVGTSGQIVLSADPGEANALSGVSLTVSGAPASAGSVAFSETRAAADVESVASVAVFDSLGNQHVVSLRFTKDPLAENAWRWEASVAEPAAITAGRSGTATFGPGGTLATFATSDGSPVTIDPGTGASSPIAVSLDADGDGALSGLSQFAAPGEVLLTAQDGRASGVLESVVVDDRGVVSGVFSNGANVALAQVVLARFTNPGGLVKSRDNAFLASANSGAALIATPGTSAGTIASGALEMSNVDLGQEFTNLIIAQRGFQANARTIATGDEMLAELVNLKR